MAALGARAEPPVEFDRALLASARSATTCRARSPDRPPLWPAPAARVERTLWSTHGGAPSKRARGRESSARGLDLRRPADHAPRGATSPLSVGEDHQLHPGRGRRASRAAGRDGGLDGGLGDGQRGRDLGASSVRGRPRAGSPARGRSALRAAHRPPAHPAASSKLCSQQAPIALGAHDRIAGRGKTPSGRAFSSRKPLAPARNAEKNVLIEVECSSGRSPAGPRRRRARSAAASPRTPSSRGMRTSTSTTLAAVTASCSSASRPSSASPTTERSGCGVDPPSADPHAQGAWSSTRKMCGHAPARAVGRGPRSCCWLVLRRPTVPRCRATRSRRGQAVAPPVGGGGQVHVVADGQLDLRIEVAEHHLHALRCVRVLLSTLVSASWPTRWMHSCTSAGTARGPRPRPRAPP